MHRPAEGPQTPQLIQLRNEPYRGVKLSRAIQQQTRTDAEIDVRTNLALATLKTERMDEHSVQQHITGLESHVESMARCNQLAQAKANSVRESYSELKGALKRLESGEAAAIALTQKNERLLHSLEQVEASFLACWPKLQAESRKSLRTELDRLRMENKGLHGEQNLTVKLLMTACRRGGTVANALVGGKINAVRPPVDFTEVMKSLNFLIVDARTERHELTGDLQAAQLKIRKLEFALYDLKQQQKRSDEKAAETEQRLSELQAESTRLAHERNLLITARDDLQASIDQIKYSSGLKENRETHFKELIACATKQLDISSKECRRLNDENDKLREKLGLQKTLQRKQTCQAESATRRQNLLRERLKSLPATRTSIIP
jgi:hypothetical protein